MKKQYPTSKKSRSATGWHKHLKKEGKRVANKGTRKLAQNEISQADMEMGIVSLDFFTETN